MVVEEGEGFGEEGQEAVDLDDDVAVRVVEAAVDGVGGAVDDGHQGGGGLAFASEGAEVGLLAGREVGFGVAEVVEAAEGGVAAEVEFQHLGGVGVDSGEGGEDFFGGGHEEGEVVVQVGRGGVGDGLDEAEGDEQVEDVFDLLFFVGAGVVQ